MLCLSRAVFIACPPLVFSLASALCYALVVAWHAVDALACLCEDELLYAAVAGPALEAGCVVGLIACHDGFFEDARYDWLARGPPRNLCRFAALCFLPQQTRMSRIEFVTCWRLRDLPARWWSLSEILIKLLPCK